MFVLEEGQVAYFDVDGTLVEWEKDVNDLFSPAPSKVEVHVKGDTPIFLRPISVHVDQLIQQSVRGVKIIVWSAGGTDYAASVVRGLGVEKYVHAVITKPNFYYDDRKAHEFMQNHYFLK